MIYLLITTIISFLITPLIIKFYRSHHWIDDPIKKKLAKTTHSQPVPRGGGLVIFFSVLVVSLLFLHVDKYLIGILLGALILTVVGFIDDIKDLHPMVRLLTGLLAAGMVVGSGIGIAYITNPFSAGVIHLDQPQITFTLLGGQHSIWILSDLFALFFILWNMNIVNWSKGLDGQLPGFVSIALIFIGILSYKFIDDPTQFNTAHLAFIVSGAFLGFLFWNFYPQKIMPSFTYLTKDSSKFGSS